jgi:hypothetical protein
VTMVGSHFPSLLLLWPAKSMGCSTAPALEYSKPHCPKNLAIPLVPAWGGAELEVGLLPGGGLRPKGVGDPPRLCGAEHGLGQARLGPLPVTSPIRFLYLNKLIQNKKTGLLA